MLFPHDSYLSSLCKCASAVTEDIQVHFALLVFKSMFYEISVL
jgi:hypothetical protein